MVSPLRKQIAKDQRAFKALSPDQQQNCLDELASIHTNPGTVFVLTTKEHWNGR